MTCNMSHVSLNWPSTSPWPGSKCDQSHPASHHLWTNTKSDGPWPDRPSFSCLVRNLLDIVKWCQVRCAVIQSFQSKLRLFQSLKTHGDRKLSRSCNLVTGSFSSRRIHLVSRSFLRYLANSGCGYCQPQDNVLPMLLRSLRRHQRELGIAKCQWDNCVTTHAATLQSHLTSDSEETRTAQVTSKEFKFIHTSYLQQPRLQPAVLHLICFLKLNSILLAVRCGSLVTVFLDLSCHPWPELTQSGQDKMIYEGVYTERGEIRTNEKWTLAWTLRHKKPGATIT